MAQERTNFLPIHISVANLGVVAAQALAQDQSASVWGITSRGIFLHLASGWVIFLSYEPFKGPLNLNTLPQSPAFQHLEIATGVRISNSGIYFDAAGLVIQTASGVQWSVPARQPASAAALAGRFERLEQVAGHVHSPSVAPLAQLSRTEIANLPRLDHSQILAALEKNLGLGEGLTPACDDQALGFLLAINRWGDRLCPELDLPATNPLLKQAAYRKTNTLSANLIECATLGQADERLALVLDGLLTGQPDPAACAAHLLSWGHTSGIHALTGMALAINPNSFHSW